MISIQHRYQLILLTGALSVLAAPASAQSLLNQPEPPVLSKQNRSDKSASTMNVSAVTPGKTKTLYWYDGARKRNVTSTLEQVADFGSKAAPKSLPQLREPSVQETKALNNAPDTKTAGISPIYLDADSGQITGALPGGVIVHVSTALDHAGAQALAERFNTQADRPIGAPAGQASTMADARYTTWLFSADTGAASLEMANQIHESGQVASAAPNWWKPRATK